MNAIFFSQNDIVDSIVFKWTVIAVVKRFVLLPGIEQYKSYYYYY